MASEPGADQFQPTHRAGYHTDRLTWLLDWLREHPDATLASGEGRVLALEIVRLRALLAALTSAQIVPLASAEQCDSTMDGSRLYRGVRDGPAV